MNEESNKNKYVTEEYLDKRLGENNQVLLVAIESILDKRLGEMDIRTDSRLEAIGNRLDEVEFGLGEKIDNIQTTLDGVVKKQEDSEQEQIIIKEEVRQMKNAFKEKLGIEIKAI